MTRRVKIAIAVPLAVLAVLAALVGVGLLAGGGGSGSSSGVSSGAVGDRAGAEAPVPEPAVAGSSAGASSKSMSAGGTDGAQGYAAAVPPASAPSAHYLVRTGDLSLLVARGTLPANVDRIKAMTAAMNGYVMSSSMGTQPSPYATLAVRVPEQLFDTAIKRFSALGDVRSVSTSSEDVTSQYVDLQARLRHYRAVERRLLGFLQQTTTVNQMLAVQDRIDKVQLTIEELSAQIKSLSETTTYGTLSVYVTEKGRPVAAAHGGSTFGGTFWSSVELLGRGARLTGLVLTAVAPFLVVFGAIGALVWYVVRRVRRGRRQTAPPTPAA